MPQSIGDTISSKNILILILGSTLLAASSVQAAESARMPYSVLLSGFAGRYYPKDETAGFRPSAANYGTYLDFLSTLKLTANYTAPKKYGSLNLTLPITLDYGMELGLTEMAHVYPASSARLFSFRGHIDLLRTLSLGLGAYQAAFTGAVPTGKKQSAYGWLADVQLTLLPYAILHPFFGVRWYGDPIMGHSVIFGFKLGSWP